ncbi:flagellar hook-length control protein FliK [Aliiglaciecola lipolytica]|uniref:Flagellar hook-length control protein FliK n=1 Tax=Aliiglaciecola lipolytica E3 TaxID=1127673 RepID=K6XU77_9ALTE|nr:flagellar hook-length control protein FliK [Aliiglaciecola lipolytica]GAC15231.1 flagellar hook-length control protein FliK [Aliiglaciecola lipolytica E3]
MQHIATAKSELAALLTKVNGHASNNFNQQTDFQSYFKQADQVYSQPVEPPKNHPDRNIEKSVDNAYDRQESQRDKSKTLRDRSKDNQAEFAKPVEQKSAIHSSETDKSAKPIQQSDKAQAPQYSDEAKVADTENQIADKNVSSETSEKKNVENDALKSEEQIVKHAEQQSEFEKAGTSDNPEKSLENDLVSATHIMIDDQVVDSEATVITDETPLIDWLTLVEKSIAKATKGETSSNKETANENVPEFSITEVLLANKSDVNSIESDPESSILGSSELENIDINVLVSENQQSEESALNGTLAGDVKTDEFIALESATTLKSLNNLIAELQTLLDAQKQKGSVDNAASLDQLLNQISDVLGESDADVMAKLRESLRLETSALEVAQSQELGTVTETDVAIADDLRLMLDLLMSSASNTNKPISNSDTTIKPNIETTSLTPDNMELAKTAVNIDQSVAALLDLPKDKLDAALANLAQRLDLKTANNQNYAGDAGGKSDFVSALKSGIEEIKAQIKQGHQPAIDLSALVNDATAKVNLVPVVPQVLDQTITRFNQTLEITSQLNAKVEQLHVASITEKALVKENNNQAQHLQNKQGQQLAQFDKAVNINRQEGLQQLSEKVRWMVNQNNLQADIRLDPPELGAMKVRLNMSGDTASVNIVVQSQQARDVLEQATPRLKELLEQQGIELGQSSVQQEQSGNAEQHGSEFVSTEESADNLTTDESEVIEQRISNGRIGGIDYFV